MSSPLRPLSLTLILQWYGKGKKSKEGKEKESK
jgi:hypothetical protein